MMKKIIWIILLTLIACQNNEVDEKSNEVLAENKNSIIKSL